MQDSIYRFSLDIHSTQSQVSIPVPQFNTARSIMATLTEGGKPYQLSHECRAVFTATKADGTTLYNDALIVNGCIIKYDFTEQTTTAEGIVDASFKVYGADRKLLTSPRFTLVVYEDTVPDPPISANEMNVIDSIKLNDVNQDAAIVDINKALIKLDAIPPVEINLEGFETEGKIVEIYADGLQKETKLEFDKNDNPVKITVNNPDGTITETALVWEKEV